MRWQELRDDIKEAAGGMLVSVNRAATIIGVDRRVLKRRLEELGMAPCLSGKYYAGDIAKAVVDRRR